LIIIIYVFNKVYQNFNQKNNVFIYDVENDETINYNRIKQKYSRLNKKKKKKKKKKVLTKYIYILLLLLYNFLYQIVEAR